MLTLYGPPWSRASRCIWMLEELGIEYELVTDLDLTSQEYRKLNPNGKVPCLVDGDEAIWESMAINLHLANRNSHAVTPQTPPETSAATMWSFWAQSELENAFNHIASLEEISQDWLEQTFSVTESALAKQAHLIAARFTVADLNVSAMFMGPVSSQLDLSPFPRTEAWRRRNYERPAAQKTVAMMVGK